MGAIGDISGRVSCQPVEMVNMIIDLIVDGKETGVKKCYVKKIKVNKHTWNVEIRLFEKKKILTKYYGLTHETFVGGMKLLQTFSVVVFS